MERFSRVSANTQCSISESSSMDTVSSQHRCLRSLAAMALWSLGTLVFSWLPMILLYRHQDYKDPISAAACIGVAFLVFATVMTARSFLSFCGTLDAYPRRRQCLLSTIVVVLLLPNVTALGAILFALIYTLAGLLYMRSGGVFLPPP